MTSTDIQVNTNTASIEMTEPSRSEFKRRPSPSLEENPSVAIARLAKSAKEKWIIWNKEAWAAIKSLDKEKLQSLKREGFYFKDNKCPEKNSNWWLAALDIENPKAIVLMAEVFPEQTMDIPNVNDFLNNLSYKDHNKLAFIKSALRLLPSERYGHPYKTLVDMPITRNSLRFMAQVGFKLIKEAISSKEENFFGKDGWGSRPWAIKLISLIGKCAAEYRQEEIQQKEILELLNIIMESCPSGFDVSHSDKNAREKAHAGLKDLTKAGCSVTTLTHLIKWAFPSGLSFFSKIEGKQKFRESKDEKAKGSLSVQLDNKVELISNDYVGTLLKEGDPQDIRLLIEQKIFDDVFLFEKKDIEHPLRARRFQMEAEEKAKKPIDMSVRFGRLISEIQRSNESAEKKESLIELFSQHPLEFPEKGKVTLFFDVPISPVATLLSMYNLHRDPERSKVHLEALSEAGFSVKEGLRQYKSIYQKDMWKEASRKNPDWLDALLEQEELRNVIKSTANNSVTSKKTMRI